MNTSLKRAALSCALLASTALATPALAQTASTTAFPVRQFSDANGVDLLSGAFTTASYEVLIGNRENGLSFQREVRQGLYADSLLGTITIDGSTYTVSIGGDSGGAGRKEVMTLMPAPRRCGRTHGARVR